MERISAFGKSRISAATNVTERCGLIEPPRKKPLRGYVLTPCTCVKQTTGRACAVEANVVRVRGCLCNISLLSVPQNGVFSSAALSVWTICEVCLTSNWVNEAVISTPTVV